MAIKTQQSPAEIRYDMIGLVVVNVALMSLGGFGEWALMLGATALSILPLVVISRAVQRGELTSDVAKKVWYVLLANLGVLPILAAYTQVHGTALTTSAWMLLASSGVSLAIWFAVGVRRPSQGRTLVVATGMGVIAGSLASVWWDRAGLLTWPALLYGVFTSAALLSAIESCSEHPDAQALAAGDL